MLRFIKRLFERRRREAFRLSYFDETHIFMRNRDRSVVFIWRCGREEVERLFRVRHGRVYWIVDYAVSSPRRSFELLTEAGEMEW